MTDAGAAVRGGGSAGAVNLDPAEIARFTATAARWWDPAGPNGQLHRINPVRLAWARAQILDWTGGEADSLRPLTGRTALDVGCGGGLVTEPLARWGAAATGLDADRAAIEVARSHAAASGLSIEYRATTVEALVAEGATFDLVTALEVVEHVPDPGAFLAALGRLVRPGGLLLLSTLNRTLRSLALAKVAAEYVLGWVPRGTHDWRRFLAPATLAAHARDAGFWVTNATGLVYDPLADTYRLSGSDLSINYLMAARR